MNQSVKISPYKRKERKSGVQAPNHKKAASVILGLKPLTNKYKANGEANRIIKSLKEVKDFESGKKHPKSFDDFLKEL
jgi:phosphopantetheine adenylyltransferase